MGKTWNEIIREIIILAENVYTSVTVIIGSQSLRVEDKH